MRKEVTIFGFVVGALLLNWPFLKIFDGILVGYVFTLWFGFILFNMFSTRPNSFGKKKGD